MTLRNAINAALTYAQKLVNDSNTPQITGPPPDTTGPLQPVAVGRMESDGPMAADTFTCCSFRGTYLCLCGPR